MFILPLQFNSCPRNLGDSLSGEEAVVDSLADVVGQRPVGIPVTAEVARLPPVLFQTKSLHHYLQIGSVPWKYLINETDGVYRVRINMDRCIIALSQLDDFGQLRDLRTSEAVEDGVLTRVDVETEQDLICFHMDDSARMMHIAEGKCR